jgi:hypothetical protein
MLTAFLLFEILGFAEAAIGVATVNELLDVVLVNIQTLRLLRRSIRK